MNPFSAHPALRWAVPSVAAVAVVAATATAGTISASAGSSLPSRTAAQLLADVHSAQLDAISGTVVQRADLGLPDVSGLTGASGGPASAGGSGSSDFSSMVSGTHTVRLWYSGPDKARIALLGSLGESDVVRNGTDLWTWSSKNNTATHRTLPTGAQASAMMKGMHQGMPGAGMTGGSASSSASPAVPQTPQQAANEALAAIGTSTVVTTTGSATVAGRSAYELVLAPKDTSSLVGQVRVAIDGARHVPLRVQVFAKGAATPAFEVAFTQVDFTRPDASQFRFTPPPGAKVTQEKAAPAAPSTAQLRKKVMAAHGTKPQAADQPKVLGSGWTSIVVAKVATPSGGAPTATPLPKAGGAGKPGLAPKRAPGAGAGMSAGGDQLTSMIAMLPKVSGSWGSGHLLAGKLFSVLVTDDGRVLAGAVTPQALYAAAAK